MSISIILLIIAVSIILIWGFLFSWKVAIEYFRLFGEYSYIVFATVYTILVAAAIIYLTE